MEQGGKPTAVLVQTEGVDQFLSEATEALDEKSLSYCYMVVDVSATGLTI